MKRILFWVLAAALVLGCKKNEVSINGFDFTKDGYVDGQEVTKLESSGFTLVLDKPAVWHKSEKALSVYAGTSFYIFGKKMIEKVSFEFGAGDPGNAMTPLQGNLSGGTWRGTAEKVFFTVDGESGHRKIARIHLSYGKRGTRGGHDIFTGFLTGVPKGGKYEYWQKNKGTSSVAVYSGNTAVYGDNAIKFDTENQSGIVSTESGGCFRGVKIKWNADTEPGKKLDVYFCENPVYSPSTLYQGGRIGNISTLVCPDVVEAHIPLATYYVGIRPVEGEVYVDWIDFYWE